MESPVNIFCLISKNLVSILSLTVKIFLSVNGGKWPATIVGLEFRFAVSATIMPKSVWHLILRMRIFYWKQ